MKVNCLSCGYSVDVDDSYSDYEGQFKCIICGAVLKIKTEEGKLKSASVVKAGQRPSKRDVSITG
jgi:predicted RNA-binding Zn-ribbon protein involved in translation (DUF1610 family)